MDRRQTPFNGTVAAKGWETRVDAARYVDPVPHRCVAVVSELRSDPSDDAPRTSEMVNGEAFDVIDTQNGWCFGQCAGDGYVGWVRALALGPAHIIQPSHKIINRHTLLRGQPDLKGPDRPLRLPYGTLLEATDTARDKSRVDWTRVRIGTQAEAVSADETLLHEGWVPSRHLAPLDRLETDPTAVARLLLGTPYLWGGKSSFGLDCSALVQFSWGACGVALPRDSDQQRNGTGEALDDATRLRSGDLIFWTGHVAMMLDDRLMIHANAHHMAVAIEPLAETCARIEAAGGGPVLRRLRVG